MTIHSLWGYLLLAAGPTAALVAFLVHLHEVKKLRLEVEALEFERDQRNRRVVEPTSAEVKTYGYRHRNEIMAVLFPTGLTPSGWRKVFFILVTIVIWLVCIWTSVKLFF